jgi:glycosyltransferase involved in cell wall biosynthesis
MSLQTRHIVSIVPFATFPPHMGGQVIINYQNRELANLGWQVEQYSAGLRKSDLRLLLKQTSLEMNIGYCEYRNLRAIPAFSFMISAFFHMPYFWAGRIMSGWPNLQSAIKKADLVIFEMPWGYSSKLEIPNSTPIIYMSHNVEHEVVQSWKCRIKYIKDFVIDGCTRQEAKLSKTADRIIAITQKDADRMAELYKLDKQKITLIPRGIDISQYEKISYEKKKALRKKLGIHDNQKIILFVGSLHGPNKDAAEFLCSIAEKIDPAGLLIIAGGVIDEIKHPRKNNLRFYKDQNMNSSMEIADYMKIADIAVNPVMGGSGMNVKVLEYMGWMLPIVSTSFGIRGIEGTRGKDYIVAPLSDFPDAINSLILDNRKRQEIGNNGRKLLEEKYAVQSTAKKLDLFLRDVLIMKKKQ